MAGSVVLVHAPIDLDGTMKVPVPLGPLYLGAVLKTHDIPVSFFDLHYESTRWADFESVISRRKPCLVGFSCNTVNVHRALHLSERLLRSFPHVSIVLGGPHVTHVWEPYLTDRRYVIRDEGENALVQLARYVLQGQGDLQSIPGLAYVAEGHTCVNPIALGEYEEVDAIPFPDYSLLPSRQFYIPAVIASRGCKHRCHFCNESTRHRQYRARSSQNVENELNALKEQYDGELRYLVFHDDTFTDSEERVHELCDVIDRVFPDKGRFGFACEGRADVLADYPELIPRLKKAGLTAIQLGIESGNQTLLDEMKKKIRCEQVEEAVALCEKAKVPYVAGNLILGLPHQTKEDVEREIAFAKHLADLAPTRIELTVKALMPYPGTEFRTNAAKWGLTILDDDFAMGRSSSVSFIETEYLSRDEIEQACKRFLAEVGDHILKQAAPLMTPRTCKDHIIMAAETSQRTFVLSRLCYFAHIARLVVLRRRGDHRFLFEVPDTGIPDCSPVSIPDNVVARSDNGFVVNPGSPLEFTLTVEEMRYFRCFAGKLTYAEIARRIAENEAISEAKAYETCLDVYMECEDSLAAITLI